MTKESSWCQNLPSSWTHMQSCIHQSTQMHFCTHQEICVWVLCVNFTYNTTNSKIQILRFNMTLSHSQGLRKAILVIINTHAQKMESILRHSVFKGLKLTVFENVNTAYCIQPTYAGCSVELPEISLLLYLSTTMTHLNILFENLDLGYWDNSVSNRRIITFYKPDGLISILRL